MSARFRTGERVRVRRADPAGHVRTPSYIRGLSGVIERVLGAFRNPETLAYGGDGLPEQPLYRVRFSLAELWPDDEGGGDEVEVEVYEHWLEPGETR